ncbi:MAG: sugar ABC transporter ATP-binding protein [Chloroflexi bacterium]|nr:MAG: sugar ABC transporter ATP-binding protein [Chloroflexota bacterium]
MAKIVASSETAQTLGALRSRHSTGYYVRTIGARLLKHGVILAFCAFFLLPWVWMTTTSLKTPEQVFRLPVEWVPDPVHAINYWDAFFGDPNQPLLLYIRNTVVIAVFSIIGAVLSNTLIAYGFACIQWPGRDKVFLIVLATLMLPFQVRMIPLYLVFKNLNWINTYLPLIVPTFFGSAFFIFLLRQFFKTLPRELFDAAYIDGASDLGILFRVVLPLVRPAIAVVALFEFINSWNDFLGPLLYLNDKLKFPIALGLRNMQNAYGIADFGRIMAASTVTVLPIVILFFFAQRTFIQGVTFSGLKG